MIPLTAFVRGKSTRMCPITKARGFVPRSTCCGQDESKDYEAKHDQNLDAAQPELKFSKETYTEVVDSNYCNQKDCNVNCGVCPWAMIIDGIEPIPDDKNRSYEVIRCRNDVFKPVVPA